jgi:hypothetical protein
VSTKGALEKVELTAWSRMGSKIPTAFSKEDHSLFLRFSAARRAVALSSLAVLAAGCSATGISPNGSSSNVGAGANGTLRQSQILANGQGVRKQAARADRGWLSPDAKKKKQSLIYWGNYDSSTITIYSAKGTNGKEIGQITSGLSNPERLFVDTLGNLYATNIGNDTITAYEPDQTSSFLTISDGVSNPTGLTVDAAGTVYCANVGNETVTVYPKGQTTPSLTISPPSTPEYLATDAQDNLYVSTFDGVIEYAPGSSTGTNLGLSISTPGGAVEVDRKGNIILLDGDSIDYFPAGKTQASNQITVSAGSPFGLSLSKNEKELYVSVEVDTESGVSFIIQSLAYPKGTALSNKLTTKAGDWPVSASPDNSLGS